VDFIAPDIVRALEPPAAVLDPDGRLIAVNAAWRAVGNLPAEPGGALPPAPPSPWDATALAAAIGAAGGPTGTAGAVVCSLRDGSRVRFRCAPLPAADGAGYALVTLDPDITDLAAGTEAVGAEHWFRTLVAALDEGFLLQDASGALLASNPAAERILGRPPAELAGDTPWPAVRLDGSPLPDDQHPARLSLRTGRSCSDVLIGVYRPDGELTWISVNSRPLVRPGADHPYAVVTSFTDITERRRAAFAARRSERRLAALVAGLPSGILVESPDGTVALANEEFCRLFGTGHPQQLAGADRQQVTAALAPLAADPAAFGAGVAELRAAGADIRGEELALRDGRTLERDFSTVDLGADGQETLWVYRDITAHKLAEQQIAAARDQALATSRAKSEFLATLSHEVRTPISGIVGMVDLLLALPLEPDVHEVVEGVRLSADALTAMLNDMVDLARIEVGRLQLDDAPFDLRQLVDGVAETLGSRARQKGLALVVRVAPQLPAQLLGDDARLRQVLLNLVGNAIKFTEVGEIVLNVEVGAGPTGAGPAPELSIEVVDSGRGMAPDALDRVFEPFVQEDASTARRHGGSGLGLAVTARLVRLMRGRVAVDSAPAVGSRFQVVLPLRQPGVAVPAARPDRLAGRRLLVAAPGVARSAAALAALLRGEGATVDVLAADPLAEVLTRQQQREPVDAVVWVDDARDTRVRARAAGVANALNPPATDPAATDPTGPRTAGADPTGPGRAATVVLLSRTDPPRRHPSGVTVLALPVRADRLLDAVRGITPVPDRPVPIEPLPGGRVLLAEDNAVNRAIIGRMLDLLGLRWDSVSDGAAAVAAASTQRYDAILMDVQMPGTDGVEATRRIRAAESDRHTPIVALTANAMGGDRETYLAAGMDDYVAKPMRLATLRATLQRYVAPALEVSAADLDAARLADLATQLQDAALVSSTVELYLSELPGRCRTITEAGERLDRGSLQAAAHALKSASAMLGATAIADLCERLMTVAEDGTAADIRALTAAMPSTASRTEVAIRRYLTLTHP
jgi:PAS domain S-box-containing protein